jgi:hypothetical protein
MHTRMLPHTIELYSWVNMLMTHATLALEHCRDPATVAAVPRVRCPVAV